MKCVQFTRNNNGLSEQKDHQIRDKGVISRIGSLQILLMIRPWLRPSVIIICRSGRRIFSRYFSCSLLAVQWSPSLVPAHLPQNYILTGSAFLFSPSTRFNLPLSTRSSTRPDTLNLRGKCTGYRSRWLHESIDYFPPSSLNHSLSIKSRTSRAFHLSNHENVHICIFAI